MITEAEIKNATQDMHTSNKARVELRDGGVRGRPRLVLILRRAGDRISADWFVQSYENQRRTMSKIATWPETSPAAARNMLDRQGAAPTATVHNSAITVDPRADGLTVRRLFESYVEHLESEGKQSAKSARWKLLRRKGAVHVIPNRGVKVIQNSGAAEAIGEDMLAADVRAVHIMPYLRAIHERGRQTHAHHMRAVIHAAFAFGLKSVHKYHGPCGVDWGLQFNPVSSIERNNAAGRAGERFLSPREFVLFWQWLEAEQARGKRCATALILLLLTGQRPREILQVSVNHYDREEAIFEWKKTKNGHPHCIPLPGPAVGALAETSFNHFGLYFPSVTDPAKPMGNDATWRLVKRYINETGADDFSPRDLRRTWKTLTGRAGLTKEIRDRLQNHLTNGVSTKHYDRYTYLKEKREAMATWSAYLDAIRLEVVTGQPKKSSEAARVRSVDTALCRLPLFDADPHVLTDAPDDPLIRREASSRAAARPKLASTFA